MHYFSDVSKLKILIYNSRYRGMGDISIEVYLLNAKNWAMKF